jgi:hypothetical protein
MAVKRSGESKQGLVVTLVFFILATLGLGIATYYGFADQDRLTKEKKDAEAKEKIANAERDWYRTKSQLLLSYVGHLKAEEAGEMGAKATEFFGGQWASKVTGAAAKADVNDMTALVTNNLSKTLPWPSGANAPAVSYESLLTKRTQDYNTLEARYRAVEKEKNDAVAANQLAQQTLEKERAAFKAELGKQSKGHSDELVNMRLINAKQDDEIKKLGLEKEAVAKRTEEERTKVGNEIKLLNKKIGDQTARIADQAERIDLLERKDKDAPPDLRTDWKVTSIDRTGKKPFINLGSADNVKPQTTFRVHGVRPDGRPMPQAKGTIEVVNVINGHLSQAQVTDLRDALHDPITPGDVLYNPTFSPDRKKHVAVAGLIDLNGDGRDDLNGFLRLLDRQNVVVDAYLDPQNSTVHGPGITVNTEYLIVGGGLDVSSSAAKDKDAAPDARKLAFAEMTRKAKDAGVQVIGLNKYLDLIGYRMPRTTVEQTPATATYRPATPAPTTPAPAGRDNGKKDEKPMEGKDT